MWFGFAVGILTLFAVVAGTMVAARERAAQKPLAGMREGLELLYVERETSVVTVEYLTAVTMRMYEGGHDEEIAALRSDVHRALREARARLDDLPPSQGWKVTHEGMAEAVDVALDGFDRERTDSELLSWLSEFLYDFKRVMPTDNLGEWTSMLEAATWAQEVPVVIVDLLDVAMAREWRDHGRQPADTALIEDYNVLLSEMRHIRESHEDAARDFTPFEEYILTDLAAESDLTTARLLQRVAGHEAVRLVEADIPYMLSLTDEHEFGSIPELYRRVREWMPELALLVEDLRTHAADEMDRALARSERLEVAAAGSAVLALIVGAACGILIVRRRRRDDSRLRSALELDSLTGLANRYSLFSVAPGRLSDPGLGSFALIHLDLDDFKSINDDFGHHVGDQALVRFGEALRSAVRETTDLVCRLGGDEFVILLHKLDDPEARARGVVDRLKRALERPLELEKATIELHFTAGIAVAREAVEMEELLVEADLALLEAKERGRDHTQFFRRKMGRRMVHELSAALGSGELRCAFQPQVDIETGAVVGLEALARWDREDRREVPARRLIDALEWLGASREWLGAVMRDAETAWRTLGSRIDGRIWLNLAGPDLQEVELDELLEILCGTDVPADRLGVEITEAVARERIEDASRRLHALREAGLAVALDGVGHERVPLLHVTELPIDRVKLDRCVITGIDSRAPLRAIVESMALLCRRLDLGILAEGVETPEECAVLGNLGIRHAQGFLFAHPLYVEALADSMSGGTIDVARTEGVA